MVQLLWKRFWQFLKWLNTDLLCDPIILLLGLYTRNLKTYVHAKTRTQVFTAASFIIAKKQKQPKMSINGQMNKHNVVYIHTMAYYPAMKRSEVLIQATAWTNLKNIMLAESSRIRKAMCYMITQKRQIYDRKQISGCLELELGVVGAS